MNHLNSSGRQRLEHELELWALELASEEIANARLEFRFSDLTNSADSIRNCALQNINN
jgi:hypothetical protein